MSAKSTYTVSARTNYNETTHSSKREAVRYAQSITDSTNGQTTVWDSKGQPIAQYCYTPNGGGKTFRACL